MLRRSVLSVAALLLSVTSLCGDDLPAEQDRLTAAAKLWITIKYFHPYLAYHDLDWDKALVDALPGIRSATNKQQYAEALSAMLKPLQDDASFIVDSEAKSSPATAKSADPAQRSPQRTWVHYGATSAFLTSVSEGENVTLAMGQGLVAHVHLSESVSTSLPLSPLPLADKPYAEMPYPSVEYRILSAIKLWGAVRNFFAYRDLMDEDWDQAFGEFLPKFIAAGDLREYNLAVAAAVTLLDDSNARIRSADLDEYFGVAPVGLRIRLVEKKPLVTEVLDDEAKAKGIVVGDIVTRLDGEDIVARIQREITYMPGSTDQSLAAQVSACVLNGPDASLAALTLQSKDGSTKEVSLKRSSSYRDQLTYQRSGDVTRFLSKAIGYLDVERLKADQIDSVLEKFRDTTGLVLDMRGSIHFDPSLLAAHFVQKPDTASAIVTGPVNLSPDLPGARALTQTASFFRVEALPPGTTERYKGKTVMLVDERTSGAAEHLGLLLETANNTTFVGTLSAGADSETTSFALPGGIAVSFSTTDIRHANGGKLQRVGLQPAETAPTTVQAVRAGRDEAIEKALDSIVSQ